MLFFANSRDIYFHEVRNIFRIFRVIIVIFSLFQFDVIDLHFASDYFLLAYINKKI